VNRNITDDDDARGRHADEVSAGRGRNTPRRSLMLHMMHGISCQLRARVAAHAYNRLHIICTWMKYCRIT